MIRPQRKTQKHHFSHSRKHELFNHFLFEKENLQKNNVVNIFKNYCKNEVNKDHQPTM